MPARELTYTVVLRQEPEGGYTALVPVLPEIVTYGETFEEAREAAKEAIALVIEDRKARGEKIPVETLDTVLHLAKEQLTGALVLLRVCVTTEEARVA